ncbi:MAG: serine hydrolase [Sphingobacteriia bacterium]|nr:serine hydrolase [Sphingobacteriia bacterium]
MKKTIHFFAAFFFCVQTFSQKPPVYFPPANQWEQRPARSLGLDSAKIAEAIQFAIANEAKLPRNQELAQAMSFGKEPFSDGIGPFAERGAPTGVIVYKGYIIAEWGEPNRPDQTHSVTKSFLSAVIGLAYDKGMIKNLDDAIAGYVPLIEPYNEQVYRSPDDIGRPQLINLFASAHNQKITWDHMLRQTSDWEGTLWGKPDWADRPADKPNEWLTRLRNEPGAVWKYNDTRVNALALAATCVWHKPLPDVLRENIMQPIGASNSWHWTGYRNSWIVLDGKLIQSVSGGGHFGGGMFINAYDMARFGWLTLNKGNWNGKQLLSEKWLQMATTPTKANPGYGFMNYFLNTEKKLLPSASEEVFVHIGNGTNMIYVDRKHELVAVVRWIENNAMDGFVKRLLSAFDK